MSTQDEEAAKKPDSPVDEASEKDAGAAAVRRRAKLCALRFVDVTTSDTGFQILVAGKNGRRSISVSEPDAKQILDELEAAIRVIRSQM